MWRFSSPPNDLNGVVFTEGYRIENDLYAGSQVGNLLDQDEQSRHLQLLGVVCRWLAFEVRESLAGREHQVTHHPGRVVDMVAMDIDPRFARVRGFTEPDPGLADAVLGDYQLNLRGKTLIDVLLTHLRHSKRVAGALAISTTIIEMCLKLYPDNPSMRRIVAEACRRLA